MIEFAQFGAGRIGAIHAGNLAGNPAARLRYVVDVNPKAAKKLADKYGATVVDRDTAINDPKIGAVVIASSTDTHADLAVAAAKAGKAIFCEKPIDLSLRRVDACLRVVAAAGVKMLVGFNRRFDPSFKSLHDRLRKGEIGVLEQVIITSRDPERRGAAPRGRRRADRDAPRATRPARQSRGRRWRSRRRRCGRFRCRPDCRR